MVEFVAEDVDLEKWREGAANFAAFWVQGQVATLDKIKEHKISVNSEAEPRDYIADLESLFLGERPCIFDDRNFFTEDLLIQFGLEKHGVLIFHPEILSKHLRKYPEYFDLGKSAEQHIREINALWAEGKTERKPARYSYEKMGIILGYPLSAVKRFHLNSEMSKNRRAISKVLPSEDAIIVEDEMGKTQIFDAYGVRWADFPKFDCSESYAFEARLKLAFETSGILDIKL